MNTTIKTQLVIAGLFVGANAWAVPFSVEGKISDFTASSITCNGAKITLAPTTVYTTPSTEVGRSSLAALLNKAPFPKKTTDSNLPGITGGTCIIEGEDDTNGNRIAASVFVEVAENVLVGPTTSRPMVKATSSTPEIPAEPFSILGVEVVLLQNTDPNAPGYEPGGRIVASTPTNGFGYAVKLNTVPFGDESSAQGYMGEDGKFYTFLVETTAGESLNAPSKPDATVQRGDLTLVKATSFKMEIRGGCTFVVPPVAPGANPPPPITTATPARSQPLFVSIDDGMTTGSQPATVWVDPSNTNVANRRVITNTTTNASCAEDTATRLPDGSASGTYRYRNDNYTGWSNVPTKVRVRVTSPTGNTEYGPEIMMTRIK